MDPCPCGSEVDYEACCGPLIAGERSAETAEALLRSRYTAYAQQEVDYLVDTVHPEKREADSRKSVEKWAKNTQWRRLQVLETAGGGPEDTEGTVEFVADYLEKGKNRKHHEIAEFKKEDGRWYFFDAGAPKIEQFVRQGPKVGRNDPCPCGSGKKYKKCCAG